MMVMTTEAHDSILTQMDLEKRCFEQIEVLRLSKKKNEIIYIDTHIYRAGFDVSPQPKTFVSEREGEAGLSQN